MHRHSDARRGAARTIEGDGRTGRRHFRRAACGAWGSGRAAPGPAMGILEKISEIEKEIARTQKNKGAGRRGVGAGGGTGRRRAPGWGV